MRLASWIKPKPAQLDLLAADVSSGVAAPTDEAQVSTVKPAQHGVPLMLAIGLLREDPNNPRTEFPDAELSELAEDIRQHGILQPIVVHPADSQGRHCIHFGAKRWRAAQRAGLTEVPVVIRDKPTDPYTQVAENQKRHGLTPLDLAHFIKTRVDAGESNAAVAKRLGMNETTLAHHLSLLDLPPVLDQALTTGRCTSPRTLHELSKLHEIEPDRVRTLVESQAEITRNVVTAMKAKPSKRSRPAKALLQADLVVHANAACDRLEHILARLDAATKDPTPTEVLALHLRIATLASRCSPGV